mmetsp:Transcript_10963/g.44844  ORF Transcript_10963/g.44844 Transcript_10963/m.44844 type:complete len:251 (+) Transcript_10963:1109-1861(+)
MEGEGPHWPPAEHRVVRKQHSGHPSSRQHLQDILCRRACCQCSDECDQLVGERAEHQLGRRVWFGGIALHGVSADQQDRGGARRLRQRNGRPGRQRHLCSAAEQQDASAVALRRQQHLAHRLENGAGRIHAQLHAPLPRLSVAGLRQVELWHASGETVGAARRAHRHAACAAVQPEGRRLWIGALLACPLCACANRYPPARRGAEAAFFRRVGEGPELASGRQDRGKGTQRGARPSSRSPRALLCGGEPR